MLCVVSYCVVVRAARSLACPLEPAPVADRLLGKGLHGRPERQREQSCAIAAPERSTDVPAMVACLAKMRLRDVVAMPECRDEISQLVDVVQAAIRLGE